MKTLLVGFICAMFFFSCTKDNSIRTFEPIVANVVDDPNFRVSSFSAQQSGGQINITFSTSLEKDIVSVVLMHGSTTTQFCTVQAIDKSGENSNSYSVIDTEPQGATTYYIVKYTTKTGEWGCSPLYQSKP